MYDYNKGTVTLQCRQEYKMSSATTVAKLLNAVTSRAEILLNGNNFQEDRF